MQGKNYLPRKVKKVSTLIYVLRRIKNYFDILNGGEDTPIYFEGDNFVMDSNTNDNYSSKGGNNRTNHLEGFIPTFLQNHEKFKEIFENMRKKKLIVFAAMFFSYNIIYGILCSTNVIHIYQNRNLIYNDYYVEHLFVKQLRDNLISIRG
ncbi:selenoprotein, putative (Sel2) [Plasmodium ovale curtisi]|uniref:Selenoprotein, putative (Sel2) n=1 Tax=Plasmodium ovale curtisi TaxID=864141 RepID=A0A1A8VPL2_PLAOA|nr:selenoprotein, putative (Sel2) [Plasmodium ovale curtisi]SBS86734.1 selenoprotein, putative (Sel2) [Plasmodium ovale curtisi]